MKEKTNEYSSMELNFKQDFPDHQLYIERHSPTPFRKEFSRFLIQEKHNLDDRMRNGDSTQLTNQFLMKCITKSNSPQIRVTNMFSSVRTASRLLRNIFSWNHVSVSRSTILFQLLVAILVSITLTEGNPVKGTSNIYNF